MSRFQACHSPLRDAPAASARHWVARGLPYDFLPWSESQNSKASGLPWDVCRGLEARRTWLRPKLPTNMEGQWSQLASGDCILLPNLVRPDERLTHISKRLFTELSVIVPPAGLETAGAPLALTSAAASTSVMGATCIEGSSHHSNFVLPLPCLDPYIGEGSLGVSHSGARQRVSCKPAEQQLIAEGCAK